MCLLGSCSADLTGQGPSGRVTAREVWQYQGALDGSHILAGCGAYMRSLSRDFVRADCPWRRSAAADLLRSHLTRPLLIHSDDHLLPSARSTVGLPTVAPQWFVQALGRRRRASYTVLTTSSKSSRGSRSIQALGPGLPMLMTARTLCSPPGKNASFRASVS